MNPVLISIGNFEIRWYAIFILIGVVLSYLLIITEGKKMNIRKDFLSNLIFWTIIFGFVGARLYYVLFNLDYYSLYPSEIIQIWKGGLAIHGAIIFGFITILFYAHKYSARTFKITDISVVPLILAQSIGRWGNFFNSEAHGAATTLETLRKLKTPEFIIKGMNIGGIYYYPTFFYESIWCFIGFITLLFLRRYRYLKVGQLTAFYLIWYGVGRFFIEISRTDALMFYGFKVAQIISILMVITGVITYILLSRKGKFEDLYNEPITGDIRF